MGSGLVCILDVGLESHYLDPAGKIAIQGDVRHAAPHRPWSSQVRVWELGFTV
jgi:hypothetical protein